MKTLKLLLISFFFTSASFADNKLGCENYIKFSNYSGMTFLSFMQEVVKPQSDQFATKGYQLAGPAQIKNVLANVSPKVKRNAISSARSLDKLYKIASQIEGKTTNLYELPNLLASVDRSVSRFDLATFMGLASCGGAIIEFAPGHYAYNIHYGTGTQPKDDRTGRSFGEGFARKADDASDKNYLQDLEEFGAEHADSMQAFYRSLISSLSSSDANNFEGISNFGKLVLTDFLAVYTAEQLRNLMDNNISIHWDAALLEVTLLGAFHSGQKEFKLFYLDPTTQTSSFTGTVYNQDNGCSTEQRKSRKARMYDYWQFSASTDPEHCKRSGINITKNEFRKLGTLITKYQLEKNPAMMKSLIKNLNGSISSRSNVFNMLSRYLINSETETRLSPVTSQNLINEFVAFLVQVKKDAIVISTLIEAGKL